MVEADRTIEGVDPYLGWLLEHWLGHRRLTRRVVEAFPEPELLGHAERDMRTFASMLHEVLSLTPAVVEGAVTGTWRWPQDRGPVPDTKDGLLEALDASTALIAERLPAVPAGRLLELETPIANRTQRVLDTLIYFIDNEIHHRAQGYVYLRALGHAPPPFYRR